MPSNFTARDNKFADLFLFPRKNNKVHQLHKIDVLILSAVLSQKNLIIHPEKYNKCFVWIYCFIAAINHRKDQIWRRAIINNYIFSIYIKRIDFITVVLTYNKTAIE